MGVSECRFEMPQRFTEVSPPLLEAAWSGLTSLMIKIGTSASDFGARMSVTVPGVATRLADAAVSVLKTESVVIASVGMLAISFLSWRACLRMEARCFLVRTQKID